MLALACTLGSACVPMVDSKGSSSPPCERQPLWAAGAAGHRQVVSTKLCFRRVGRGHCRDRAEQDLRLDPSVGLVEARPHTPLPESRVCENRLQWALEHHTSTEIALWKFFPPHG